MIGKRGDLFRGGGIWSYPAKTEGISSGGGDLIRFPYKVVNLFYTNSLWHEYVCSTYKYMSVWVVYNVL